MTEFESPTAGRLCGCAAAHCGKALPYRRVFQEIAARLSLGRRLLS